MRCENLEEDGRNDGHTDDEVPTDVELCELALEHLGGVGGAEEVVVSEDEHEGVVDVLEDEDGQSPVDVVVTCVLGVSELSNI